MRASVDPDAALHRAGGRLPALGAERLEHVVGVEHPHVDQDLADAARIAGLLEPRRQLDLLAIETPAADQVLEHAVGARRGGPDLVALAPAPRLRGVAGLGPAQRLDQPAEVAPVIAAGALDPAQHLAHRVHHRQQQRRDVGG